MGCQTKPNTVAIIGCFLIMLPVFVWSIYSTVQDQNAVRDKCQEQGGKMVWTKFSEGHRWECKVEEGIK